MIEMLGSHLVRRSAPVWAGIVCAATSIGFGQSVFSSFTTSARRDSAWSELFHRKQGWTGADGIFAIPLSGYEGPDHADKTKTLFVFSDTFIGAVDSATGARRNARMINNSLALIDGAAPDSSKIRFLWGTDSVGAAASAFGPKTPAMLGKQAWHWLQDGFCRNRQVNILSVEVIRDPSGPAGFQFKVAGVGLLTLPVGAADEIDLSQQTQADAPLYYHSADHTVYFGCGIMPNTVEAGAPNPDGYVYVYGRYEKPFADIQLSVARVAADSFADFSQWRFWDGQTWSKDIATSASLGRGGAELSVTPVVDGPLKGKFLLVSMQMERDVFIRIGDGPAGPFGDRINIYHTPEPDAGDSIYTYNAKAHPSLSSGGQWLISYNVNTNSLAADSKDAGIYRPRFITLSIDPASALRGPHGDGGDKGFKQAGLDENEVLGMGPIRLGPDGWLFEGKRLDGRPVKRGDRSAK